MSLLNSLDLAVVCVLAKPTNGWSFSGCSSKTAQRTMMKLMVSFQRLRLSMGSFG